MSSKVKKAEKCPNCGQLLSGENFCPNCGQKNDVRRVRFRHFIAESLSNFFAVDGRFMHTLRNLFTRPGLVPKDYIEGKRQQYVHPVRIYFLASVLLLAVVEYSDRSDELIKVNEGEQLEAEEKPEAPTNPTDSLMAELAGGSDPEPKSSEAEKKEGKMARMMTYYQQEREHDAAKALADLNLNNTLWNRFLYDQSVKVADFDDREFSRFFASKLFWVLFLFLPLLAGLHHLLYLRRKFYYPEHLFFTFYNQAAFFIMLTFGLLLLLFTEQEWTLLLVIAGFLIYQFLALRRFYGQGRGKTIAKFIILNLMSLPLFALFFIIAALFAFILF